MSVIDDVLFYLGYLVQLLAFLGLAVGCLMKMSRAWAFLGLGAALCGLFTTGWSLAGSLALRLGDGGLATADLFYTGPMRFVSQLAYVVMVVLLVAAVLVGRRAPAPDHSGPTGTTFRQLPGGVRWE